MDKSKILENILLTIKCFINRYQCDDNFLFLSESDIQCSLYSDLMKTVNYRLQLPITEKQGIERVHPVINIIQTEYSRIDIACIDQEESIEEINKSLSAGKSIDKFVWKLPLLAGIELKYLQYNYVTQQKVDDFRADIVKLEKIKEEKPDFVWVALAFVQNDSALKVIIGDKKPYITRDEAEQGPIDFGYGFLISPKQIIRIKKQ